MAGVAQSMMLNLKVAAEDIRNSLSALVVAGKSDSFELKDMGARISKPPVTGRPFRHHRPRGPEFPWLWPADRDEGRCPDISRRKQFLQLSGQGPRARVR